MRTFRQKSIVTGYGRQIRILSKKLSDAQKSRDRKKQPL